MHQEFPIPFHEGAFLLLIASEARPKHRGFLSFNERHSRCRLNDKKKDIFFSFFKILNSASPRLVWVLKDMSRLRNAARNPGAPHVA